MDEKRLENLIEETLSTMDPVEVPKDLHFDAAKIMRLAKMQEEEEAERTPAPVSFFDRMRETFRSRSWTRYAAAAAAFVVLLGIYGMTRDGSGIAPVPGSDPSHVAEIGDDTIPLAPPDDPIETEDPVQSEDPVTPEVPDEGPQTETPDNTPVPPVTPSQPPQSADSHTPAPQNPTPQPPSVTPQQPDTEPEEPGIVEDPPVEEEPDEVDNPTEYAGGNEIDPDEETQNPPEEEGPGEEPGDEQTEPADPEDPEENIYENMLAEALQDEEFAAEFAAEDKGFGHNILSVEDVPDGTEFMVYFYEDEEEAASGTVNEDNIRSILWKKESL